MRPRKGVSPLGGEWLTAERHVLRRPAVNAVEGGVMLVVGILMIVGAASAGLGLAIALGIPGVLIAFMGARFFVIRVEISPAGVAIYNIWRNYRFSWDDIVEIVPATRTGPRPIGVKTVTGRIVRFTGITPGRGERASVSDKWLDLVEASRAAYSRPVDDPRPAGGISRASGPAG